MSERDPLATLQAENARLIAKIAVIVKPILLALKAVIISYKNEKDEGLVEVPNPLK